MTSLRFWFFVAGLLIIAVFTAPVRYLLSQFILPYTACKPVTKIGNIKLNRYNIYEDRFFNYVREHSCNDLIKRSEKLYVAANVALKKRAVKKARNLLDQSIVLFPAVNNIVFRAEIDLIIANRSYRTGNRKNGSVYYKVAWKKLKIAHKLARRQNNRPMVIYSKKLINCIENAVGRKGKPGFCGLYRSL